MGISEDFGILSYGSSNRTVNILVNANGTFTREFSYELGSAIKSVKIDGSGLYYFVIANDQKLHTFYHCATGCVNCSFPNNCSVCEEDYILKGAYCFPKPTQCVGNVVLKGNVCEEYCHKKCRTCNQTRTDCYECSDFYAMDSSGECVI